ncbi:hypothetical protein KQX54_006574 [Cotesia glomerata]|uniref:Uncharacterized protein n=1 Tax=Cotesia glomerata TaxID=32391 RepID=A0AAV7HRL2_COTGL|nr:hypothetical protein KQX54_006574 [Cotesia glomerata]
MGELYLSMMLPDGSERIMKPTEDLLFLSDHQMERMLDFNVIAAVSRDAFDFLKRPGFGLRIVILKKDGTLKSFMYNLLLLEAVKQLPQDYPYNFSTSKHAYHNAFQNLSPTKLDFHL